jgi:hypothetical protein
MSRTPLRGEAKEDNLRALSNVSIRGNSSEYGRLKKPIIDVLINQLRML